MEPPMPTVNVSQATGLVAGFKSVLISPELPNARLAFPPVLRSQPSGQLVIGTTNGRDAPQERHWVRELVYLHGPRLVILATDIYVLS
jgi:hypothetical protein